MLKTIRKFVKRVISGDAIPLLKRCSNNNKAIGKTVTDAKSQLVSVARQYK